MGTTQSSQGRTRSSSSKKKGRSRSQSRNNGDRIKIYVDDGDERYNPAAMYPGDKRPMGADVYPAPHKLMIDTTQTPITPIGGGGLTPSTGGLAVTPSSELKASRPSIPLDSAGSRRYSVSSTIASASYSATSTTMLSITQQTKEQERSLKTPVPLPCVLEENEFDDAPATLVGSSSRSPLPDPDDTEEDDASLGAYVELKPPLVDIVPRKHARANILEKFEIIKELGSGVSGSVFECRVKATKQRFALKQIPLKKSWAVDVFMGEYKFLKRVDNNGIVQVHSVYADESNVYLLTELGIHDLFRRVKAVGGPLPEEEVKNFVKGTLKTLQFLHQNHVVHRDIKPENVVAVERPDGQLEPKMIDFGDALVVTDSQTYKEFVGTHCYLAPERFRQHKGWELKASDVWAVGVMAFEVSTGKRCFYGKSKEHTQQKIEAGVWKYPRNLKPSPLLCSFIECLLVPDDRKRPTAEYALKHPWFTTDTTRMGHKDQKKVVKNGRKMFEKPPKKSTYYSLYKESLRY